MTAIGVAYGHGLGSVVAHAGVWALVWRLVRTGPLALAVVIGCVCGTYVWWVSKRA